MRFNSGFKGLNEVIVLRYFLFSNFLYSLNLKKEAMYFSETSAVVYKSTRYITFYKTEVLFAISTFRQDVIENCALLSCYTAIGGNFLPNFRDNYRTHFKGSNAANGGNFLPNFRDKYLPHFKGSNTASFW